MSDGTSDLPLAVQYMVLLTMAETREDVEGIAEDAMTNDRLDQFQKDGLEAYITAKLRYLPHGTLHGPDA